MNTRCSRLESSVASARSYNNNDNEQWPYYTILYYTILYYTILYYTMTIITYYTYNDNDNDNEYDNENE